MPEAFANKNQRVFDRHVGRHAGDFGISLESENVGHQYVEVSQEFLQRAIKGRFPAIEYPNGGEIGIYEPATNTFGLYNSKGQTISFYKPTSDTYFERQIENAIARGGRIINTLPKR